MQGNKTIIFIGLGLLLVIAALEMVITSRNPAKGLIHHSDRGRFGRESIHLLGT